MSARTGDQYLKGLRDGRRIWLNGEKVADVTAHPAFAGAARSIADTYDLQHAAPDVCLEPDPRTGALRSLSHLIPRSREDLVRRRACLRRIAESSAGLLGRSPDFLNVQFAGFAGRADVFSRKGNEIGAANLLQFQQELADRDWALTHAQIHPTIDRGMDDTMAGGGAVALHKVEDTEHGILVRGARVLATLTPFSDEIAIYPGQPLPEGAGRYALMFSIPIATPGLKFVCRDSVSSTLPVADRPFSSRFDEQDAFVIFDNVEVPRSRVFIDGNVFVYNAIMTSGWAANTMQQTMTRAHVKLMFAYELATRMAQVVNASDGTTLERLGEIWSYAELTRAALHAAEDQAYEWGNGTWFCDDRPFRALRPNVPLWFARVNEIIKLIGGHNLLATPTEADFADPELRPHFDLYLQGANQSDAAERVRLFRAAWDFVGSGLGGRNELYERFYQASSARAYRLAHMAARRELATSLVDALLKPSK